MVGVTTSTVVPATTPSIGRGDDEIFGGAGADAIDAGTGTDFIRFNLTSEFGDTISNFVAGNGRIEFGNALNTAYDDGSNNNDFLFASGNNGAVSVNAVVGQNNGDIEALY